MPYGISRQVYYYSGDQVVEIQCGGIDYAGPDMLACGRFGYGEGREFDDPKEATFEAIKILRAWRRAEPEEEINLTVRGMETSYFGMEGEPWTVHDVIVWAREAFDKLDKCAYCSEIMPENGRYGHEFTIDDDYPFCSENCASNDHQATIEDWQRENEEEEYA